MNDITLAAQITGLIFQSLNNQSPTEDKVAAFTDLPPEIQAILTKVGEDMAPQIVGIVRNDVL